MTNVYRHLLLVVVVVVQSLEDDYGVLLNLNVADNLTLGSINSLKSSFHSSNNDNLMDLKYQNWLTTQNQSLSETYPTKSSVLSRTSDRRDRTKSCQYGEIFEHHNRNSQKNYFPVTFLLLHG